MRILITTAISVAALGGNALACPPPPPPRYIEPPAPIEGEAPGDYALRQVAHQAEVAAAEQAEKAESEARILQWQTQWWDEADQVFVARVDSSRLIDAPHNLRGYFEDGVASVRLRPLRWLKGEGAARAFNLTVDDFTSCGPVQWPAVSAGAGAMFIVYARAGAVRGHDDISAMIAPSDIADPRVREAFWSPDAQ